jgi:hypothetical protein
MQAMMAAMPPGDQARLRAAAMVVSIRGEKDSCWLGKTIYSEMLAMPNPSRVGLLRALATTSAPAAATSQVRRS